MRIKRDLEPVVMEILTKFPDTRRNDNLLISKVIQQYINTDLPFSTVMEHASKLGLPSFESITRCRRKLQEQNHSLRDDDIVEIRNERQEEYISYAFNLKYE